ncbi:MAG: hypothetical protein NVS3B11_08400 [Collimonas sp.]
MLAGLGRFACIPMATAFQMVFLDVVKELPATLLLRPFNTDMLAVVTHNLARGA